MLDTSLGAVFVEVGVAVIGAPNENTGGTDIDEVGVGFVETPDNEANPKLLTAVGRVTDAVDAAATPDVEGNPKTPAPMDFWVSFPVENDGSVVCPKPKG